MVGAVVGLTGLLVQLFDRRQASSLAEGELELSMARAKKALSQALKVLVLQVPSHSIGTVN
jgi:hypothetical protein